jgi:asparaginyl-tRNA synthetase
MFKLQHTLIKQLFDDVNKDKTKPNYILKGWVRSIRKLSEIIFVEMYDGSYSQDLQLVIDKDSKYDKSPFYVGSTITVTGKINYRKNKQFEIKIDTLEITGKINEPSTYIPAIKKANLEFLRNHQHYRSKFRSFGSIFRIRSKLTHIIHDFFRLHNFCHLDPNIITTSDCEGAGQVFTVTKLLDNDEIDKIPLLDSTNKIDFTKDFFNKPAYLTVSSQLQLEALCAGMGAVYTTNPSFRAEPSLTKRHLCSFTHLEYEIPFISLSDLMDFSEDLLKYCIDRVLTECIDDLNLLDKFISKGIISKLKSFLVPFERISYEDAIKLIEKNRKDILGIYSKDLKDIPKFGDDLRSNCEKYLTDVIFKKPIFVFNYPKSLKSFYMKQNDKSDDIDDSRLTVQACDLLVPQLGELIGASVREDNYDKLIKEMKDRKMNIIPLQFYLDLRKNAATPTAGGGLGFDRLVSVCTLMDGNIRDVVPFPVAYNECNY